RMTVAIGALTVEVHAPEGVPLFAEAKASAAVGPSAPVGSDAASRIFLEGLIQRGEIDLSSARGIPSARAITASLPDGSSARPSKFTHFLAPGDGAPVLKRSHFNCGFCSVGTDSASWLCA
ncbi:hypothetical protein AB4144_50065, partial [Rhizobiaceae sp. 2RAB30]